MYVSREAHESISTSVQKNISREVDGIRSIEVQKYIRSVWDQMKSYL